MRPMHALGCLTLPLLGLACSGTPGPAAPDPALAHAPLPVYEHYGVYTFNAGIQTMSLDLETMTGTVTPKARTAAFNGDLFYLNINQFAGGFPVSIKGLAFDVDQNLELTYEVAHPFPAAANLAQPANGFSNRADLGIAGRVMFLFGVDTTTLSSDPMDEDYLGDHEFVFDTETVRLQTKVLLNPAGYYDPAGMVPPADRPAGNATAFPFQTLVDETAPGGGSRVGISNGGVSTGNYNPNAGGWQNSNIGPNNDGWTGYGVLHQGQASRNKAVIDLDAVSGPLDLDFAVIASYVDPRQGDNAATLRSNRIPKNNSPSSFAYRMPHGAVDLEYVAIGIAAPFTTNPVTQTGVNVLVADQDADAAVDTDFPGQGGIRLDEVPTASGIEGVFASSLEMGIANVQALPQGGVGSYEVPKGFTFFLNNVTGSDGGVDGHAALCVRVVDIQRQADEGWTLNNQNPPLPVPAGQEQKPIVYQVRFAEIQP